MIDKIFPLCFDKKSMLRIIFKHKMAYVIIGLYLFVLAWWIKLNITGHHTPEAYYFDWSYGLIGLTGSLYSIFYISKIWGGFKSVIGRGLIFIPFGLLGQWIGLQIWTYYNIVLKIAVPYPSWADVGYFSLVPAYTLGSLMFAQATGAKFNLKTKKGKIFAFIIPAIMLLLAYYLFVKDIGITKNNFIKTFFDFGYPLGEIIPVSIAMYTLSYSKKFFGGKFRNRILYLIFAFSFQFITEYYFLYTSGNNTYYNGSFSDLLYATSYTIMSLGLLSFINYE